jgi:hypothetical protein
MMHEPDELAPSVDRDSLPTEISVRTLRMIDQAAENLRGGIVGPPVDPERLKRLAS